MVDIQTSSRKQKTNSYTYTEKQKKRNSIKTIEKRLIKIGDLDNNISIQFEYISDEDWDLIQSPLDTPLNSKELIDLKKEIETFNSEFDYLSKVLKKIKIEKVLLLLERNIFLTETKMVQFFLFERAMEEHKQIFGYFFNKILNSKYKKSYIPFYASLLVRLDISKEFKEKYFEYFFKYTQRNENVVTAQFFLYVMCFLNTEKYKSFALMLFEKYRNKIDSKISEVFAKIFGIKLKKNNLYRKEETVLAVFPFDKPIIQDISNRFEDYFVDFS